MCQTGINTADYKLAVHQLTEHSKLLATNAEQWARLAGAAHEDELASKLQAARTAAAEATALLEAALEELRHDHSHEHDHGHGHVHISEV